MARCAWLEADPRRLERFQALSREVRLGGILRVPMPQREALVRQVMAEHFMLDDGLPDLRKALPPDSPDQPWVREVQLTLLQLRERGVHVAVDRCQWEPGPPGWVCLIGVNVSEGVDIEKGDLLRAGFAATRRPDGQLEVTPRLHRALCANGSVMYERDEPGTLHTAASVGDAVRACLSRELLQRQVRRLRVAAAHPVERVRAVVRALPIPRPVREEALIASTTWQLLNVLTAHARERADLLERLELERGVATILARLPSMPGVRRAGRARTLDGRVDLELVEVR